MAKVFSQFIGVLLLTLVSLFVAAWGYQIVWNDIVLNIWQMFADGNVVTLPYGVFVAVTAGVGLIRKQESDKSETLEEAISKQFGKIVTRLIWIGITLLIVAIVF